MRQVHRRRPMTAPKVWWMPADNTVAVETDAAPLPRAIVVTDQYDMPADAVELYPVADATHSCIDCGTSIQACGETPALCCFTCDHGPVAAAIGQARCEREDARAEVERLRASLADLVNAVNVAGPVDMLPLWRHAEAVLAGQGDTPPEPGEYARLSVNINDECAQILRGVKAGRGWSTTEAIRQAIGLLGFFENARGKLGDTPPADLARTIREAEEAIAAGRLETLDEVLASAPFDEGWGGPCAECGVEAGQPCRPGCRACFHGERPPAEPCPNDGSFHPHHHTEDGEVRLGYAPPPAAPAAETPEAGAYSRGFNDGRDSMAAERTDAETIERAAIAAREALTSVKQDGIPPWPWWAWAECRESHREAWRAAVRAVAAELGLPTGGAR